MNLYIDIGNSNIKMHFVHNNENQYERFETKSNHSVKSLYSKISDDIKNQTFNNVFVCSVVPSVESIIVDMIKEHWSIEPIIISNNMNDKLTLDIDDENSLGSDLYALASFLSSKTTKGVMVNVGTATTFLEVVDNRLNGVVIAPGLTTSYNALIGNADKLKEINFVNEDLPIGKNTIEALSIGTLKGHAKMIEGIVSDIDNDHTIFISGGNAKKILTFLDEDKFTYIEEATLEGMKYISNL